MADGEVRVDGRGLKRPYATEKPATVGKLDRIRETDYGEHSGVKRSRSYSDFQSSDTGYTSESETVADLAMESKMSVVDDVASVTDNLTGRRHMIDTADANDGEAISQESSSKYKHQHLNTVRVSRENGVNGDGLEEDSSCRNGTDADDSISEISGLSDTSLSGAGRWHPMKGMVSWIHRQMDRGTDPRDVLRSLVPPDTDIPEDWDNLTLWKLIISLMSEPPRRKRLHDVTTISDVVRLLQTSNKILVLTGAGVSVSCGIPDFRSASGIYARLAVDYPDLPNPQAMFDISYFRRNPKPFFQFAKEIYPGQFEPSLSHRFINHLERDGRLLRNYTQNIDTLEQAAGISRVVQCHGSFATASCMVCSHQVDAEAIRADIMNQVIPKCSCCDRSNDNAILKPDIVFFGQSLPEEFHRQMQLDKDDCDLLIVIGSSLKVQPVALIPSCLPEHVPQILINREPLKHLNFDVELLGDADAIVNELCHLLGGHFESLCSSPKPAVFLTRDQVAPPVGPTTVDDSVAGKRDLSADAEVSATALVDTGPAACPPHLPPSVPAPTVDSADNGVAPSVDSTRDLLTNECVSEMTISEKTDAAGTKTVSRLPPDIVTSVRMKPTSWATLLKDNSFMQLCPRRYIFTGAEVYVGANDSISNDEEDDEDEDLSSESDMSSSLGSSNELTDADEPELDVAAEEDLTRQSRVDLPHQVHFSDSNDSVDP
jgi:NAD-dependent deacetylase sirtuin 1